MTLRVYLRREQYTSLEDDDLEPNTPDKLSFSTLPERPHRLAIVVSLLYVLVALLGIAVGFVVGKWSDLDLFGSGYISE
jgi:hypothetical protein